MSGIPPVSAEDDSWVDLDERISAICVSVVSGVGLDEVILRFGVDVTTSTRTMFADAFNSHLDRPMSWRPSPPLEPSSRRTTVGGAFGLAERVSCGGTLAQASL
ncbi:MAG: hypothetical protein H0W16_00425 [Actinobacteria bacterium]|nr:hypothetical protein [Actinomycetota bacterium]